MWTFKYPILVFFLIVSMGNAQEKLPLISIMTYDQQPYVNVILKKMDKNRLYLNSRGKTLSIKLDSVQSVETRSKSHSFVGGLLGMAAGGGMAYYIFNAGNDRSSKDITSGFFQKTMIVSGAVAGGVLAASFGKPYRRKIIFKKETNNTERTRRIKTLLNL